MVNLVMLQALTQTWFLLVNLKWLLFYIKSIKNICCKNKAII